MRDRKRVAIVSDTHGFLSPEVLQVVKTCQLAIHAGDIGNQDVLEQLKSAAGKLVAVTGNNDLPRLWPADQQAAVSALSRTAELELPGGLLAVEHGHIHGRIAPDHEKLRQAHHRAKAIVYGHTHKRVIDQSKSPWVVNPGAAGHVRNHGGPSCLVLSASLRSWDFKEFRF